MAGPGTPIVWRPNRWAARAVTSEPLRWAASTTTVPLVRAAITRFRSDESARRRMIAGRQLPDHESLFRDPGDQLGVSARVGPVDPAGEYGDGGAAGAEGAAVGGAVDPVGTAGHDHPAVLGEAGAEGGRHVRAVLGAGAGAHDGDRI